MPQRGSPGRARVLLLEGAADPVSRSRDFARRALASWKWLPEAAEDVLLLVSELVSNACLHGGGPGTLLLHWTPERLRIEVTDGNPAPPLRAPATDPGQPGGHGLLIVDRLSRSWGSHPGNGGKCVWLEVSPG
ncbi:ATPase [Streptomyces cirratus]|uniref:ATPase n=1 Tax=Streptomyces cirratus TaxID=68187 RepID=A0ABQ3ETG0_9ACTN|nr:ATP-binding protein [Streptomyces cirratus]GHB60476.1 ATPase [Streptomyces cirratus]